jgi:hypothetical protein
VSAALCIDVGRRHTRAFLSQDGTVDPVQDAGQWIEGLGGVQASYAPRGASPSCVVVDDWGAWAGYAAAVVAAHSPDASALWLYSIDDDQGVAAGHGVGAARIFPDFVVHAQIRRVHADARAHFAHRIDEAIVSVRTDASPRRRHAYARAAGRVSLRTTFVDASLLWYFGSDLVGMHECLVLLDVGMTSASAAVIRHRRSVSVAPHACDDVGGASITRALCDALGVRAASNGAPLLGPPPTRDDVLELVQRMLIGNARVDFGRTSGGAPYAGALLALDGEARAIASRLLVLANAATDRGGCRQSEPTAILAAGALFETPFGRMVAEAAGGLDPRFRTVSDSAGALGLGFARLTADDSLRSAAEVDVEESRDANSTADTLMGMAINDGRSEGQFA